MSLATITDSVVSAASSAARRCGRCSPIRTASRSYLAVEAALRAIDWPAIRHATTRPKLMFCDIGSDMPGAPVGIPN
jgi:hypothetical protein